MVRALNPATLPDDTLPRLKILVENSGPDPDKPPLRPEVENALQESDRVAAGCYAEMEELSYRTHRLAEKIRNSK